MLQMEAVQDVNLKDWLKRKENVYTSPNIQNEVIKLMGLQLLRDMAAQFQASPFLTIRQMKQLMLPTLLKLLSFFIGSLMTYKSMKTSWDCTVLLPLLLM